MVSALPADVVKNPVSALEELFDSHSQPREFPQIVTSHFADLFKTDHAFYQIPLLALHNPPEAHAENSLVRFRAIVQDTSPSPELYLYRFLSGKPGGWGLETAENNPGGLNTNDLRQCNVLWATTVPGESAWFANELNGTAAVPTTHAHKPMRPHKYPDSSDFHVGVQVKVYDELLGDELKPGDVTTFVGILCHDMLHGQEDDPLDVPTLHVLFIRPDAHHLSRPFPLPAPQLPPNTQVQNVREDLIKWLASEALCGDEDAAEWVLLASIAHVQSRHPPLLQPSLTISSFPAPLSTDSHERIPFLTRALSLILPLTHTLPLTLDFLNTRPFLPESRDEDLNSGELQLAHGTVITVYEGGITEGKISEKGISNVHALQELMASQSLAYSFPFSQHVFHTDINCIILSTGKKSAFFKTDLNIPLCPKCSDVIHLSCLYKPGIEGESVANEKLQNFRDLVVGARAGRVEVSKSVSEHIQQSFVEERQRNKAITPDDLVRWMTVAKLYALSCHHQSLSVDDWELAKALDGRRIARLT